MSAEPKVTHFAPPFRKIDPDAFAAAAKEIPALQELAGIDQWVCWRAKRGDGGKWDKPPCSPEGVIRDAHDPENWCSLDKCLVGVRAGLVHGVGFVATADDPYVLVDLDKIRDPDTGVLDEAAAGEVAALRSYTESSVSGTGVHVIVRLDDPKRLLLDGSDGGKRASVEIYRAGRYFTFTGEHLPDTPSEICEADDALQSLWRRRIRPDGPSGSTGERAAVGLELPDDLPKLDQEKRDELLQEEPKAKATWNLRRSDMAKADGSPDWSSHDQSLANFAARWSWPPDQIWALIVAFRMKHGEPDDVQKAIKRRDYIRETIAKAQAWAAEEQAKRAAAEDGRDYSEDGLALSLGDLWRDDARYVALWGRWLFWDGTRWEIDAKLRHMARTRKFVLQQTREMIAKVGALDDEKALKAAKQTAKGMRSAKTIAAVVSLARSNEELIASPDIWDKDPRLLGTPAGVVDLRTGQLAPAQREAFITKRTAVAPDPRGTLHPMWDAFLARIFRHDLELVPYLQRLLGYAATGLTVEQKLYIARGEGQNGKRVFFNTAFGILGEYAEAASGDLLLATTAIRHPTELASLRGARLVLMSEVPDNAMWNEPLLKRLTGEDPIKARFMHQDEFTYLPAFTPVLQVNQLPRFNNPDLALRRRIELIPFSQTIPDEEKDEHLFEKLRPEWPAILRWVLDGAVSYLDGGLRPPKGVRLATEAYLAKGDLLSGWLDDCCECGPSARWTNTTELHSHFASWCSVRGARVISVKAMSQRLEREKGFEKVITMVGRGFHIEIVGQPTGEDDG